MTERANNGGVGSEPGMKRFFTLSLHNPLIKYALWLLFILLVIRLGFVGFRGVIVPVVGERAENYYQAPRTLNCQKPNPQFSALAEKAKNELSTIYVVNNSHLETRDKLLREVEAGLAADLIALEELERQVRGLEARNKSKGMSFKESPYYRKEKKEASKEDEGGGVAAARAALEANIRRTVEHAGGLVSTVAPGFSPAQRVALVTIFRRNNSLLRDSLRAASVTLDEIRTWMIVETMDYAFQRDRAQGIAVGSTGKQLGEAQRVYSYVEVVDAVRGSLVNRIISENFPRLKGSEELTTLVGQIAVASIKPNLSKDREATERAMRQSIDGLPRTVAVEFAQGQTIVTRNEVVEPWQAECIGRFSARSVEAAQMGDFMGLPVPTLLLLLGITVLAVLASLALRVFATRVFNDVPLAYKDYLAVGVLLVLHMAMLRLLLFAAGVFSLSYPALSKGTMLTACPVALSTMVIATLLGVRVSFLALLFLLLMTSVVTMQTGTDILSGNFPAYHMLYMMVCSLVGAWVTRQVTRRGTYFVAGLASGGIGVLFWGIVMLFEGGQLPFLHLLQLSLASLASGFLSYILLISLTPLFEYLWDYTTDSRLIELASSEHPALKELSRSAPGTYQHSLWISTLVEESAEAIGANALLAKVGAYYHDLGKLSAAAESGLKRGATDSPLFFAENQAMGSNPHDHLAPLVSARILRRHVELSIKMIRKYRLGKRVEDIAAQHHGTSIMLHFYNKARMLAEAQGGEVVEADFRYPGPRPQSKEAALVMLADSVEAAVRALGQHTEENITHRVQDLVRKRRTDGQLDESTLTFGDVKMIEESFIKTLVNMYHARPEYAQARPEEKTVRLKRDDVGLDPNEEISTVELKKEGAEPAPAEVKEEKE